MPGRKRRATLPTAEATRKQNGSVHMRTQRTKTVSTQVGRDEPRETEPSWRRDRMFRRQPHWTFYLLQVIIKGQKLRWPTVSVFPPLSRRRPVEPPTHNGQ